jgi:hypothetical protein
MLLSLLAGNPATCWRRARRPPSLVRRRPGAAQAEPGLLTAQASKVILIDRLDKSLP